MGALKQFLIGVAEEMGLDPADPNAVDEAQRRLSKLCHSCTNASLADKGICDNCTEDMWSQYEERDFTKEELDDMEKDYYGEEK